MNSQQRILYVSHAERACGVYQFGDRIGHALVRSNEFRFEYVKCSNEGELRDAVRVFQPAAIVYNYYPDTMGWLQVAITGSFDCPQIGTIHEVTQSIADRADNSLFHYHIAPDPTLLLQNPIVFKTGRLVQPYHNTSPHPSRITVGSFGFGTNGKGVETLVATVQESFQDATIRLHIPYARFGDADGANARRIVERCKSLVYKPGITLEFSHDFLDEPQLLGFLAQNSINAFFYDRSDARGISSVIDYALAVQRPIAIRRTSMFRHIWDASPSICVEDQPLENIISNGTLPLDRYVVDWSEANLIWDYERIVRKVLSRATPPLTVSPAVSKTFSRRAITKLKRIFAKIKRRIRPAPPVTVARPMEAQWIRGGGSPIDTWNWRSIESYQPVQLDHPPQFNRILDNKARAMYRPTIAKLFQLLPDLMARKIPEANVQQAFTLDAVVRFAGELGSDAKILCVGSFEDSAAWGLKRLGFKIEEVDPVMNYDLNEFMQRPTTARSSYDIVFSVSVIEHVEDDELFLEQMSDLLKPGGICVLTCDYKDSFVVGDHKPAVDWRLYTQKDFTTRLLPRVPNCALLGTPDWDCETPDFRWEDCDYTFATLTLKKNGGHCL